VELTVDKLAAVIYLSVTFGLSPTGKEQNNNAVPFFIAGLHPQSPHHFA
jgi:hypothetical protein